MKTITKEELKIILDNHKLWLDGSSKGKKADLSGSDLRGSNLCGADLRWSNLSGSDLSGSDLRGSNLSGSDLRGSSLSGAKTDKKYVSIIGIGSRKGMTTYCVEDNYVWCSCWQGQLSEFELLVKEKHKDNLQYLKEYQNAIKFFRSFKEER